MNVNLGCGPYYVNGWVNLDVVRIGSIRPDHVVPVMGPWPFEDGSVDRLYAGHVLEHIPWETIGEVMTEMRRVLKPGGEVCIVGPDIYKVVAMFGTNGGYMLESTFEDDRGFQPDGDSWAESRHHWNCYGARLVRLLEDHGFNDVTIEALDDLPGRYWPLVSTIGWQCAVTGTR